MLQYTLSKQHITKAIMLKTFQHCKYQKLRNRDISFELFGWFFLFLMNPVEFFLFSWTQLNSFSFHEPSWILFIFHESRILSVSIELNESLTNGCWCSLHQKSHLVESRLQCTSKRSIVYHSIWHLAKHLLCTFERILKINNSQWLLIKKIKKIIN